MINLTIKVIITITNFVVLIIINLIAFYLNFIERN